MPYKNVDDRIAYDKRRQELPEVKARRRASQSKAYRERPEVKARMLAQSSAWAKANRAKRNETHRMYRETRRTIFILHQVKKRAARKGLPYDLNEHVEDIQRRMEAGACELTGYPLDLVLDPVKHRRKFNGPSIDRIDSTKGYTYDNIRVVLNIVNYAMNVYGEDVLREVMSYWLAEK